MIAIIAVSSILALLYFIATTDTQNDSRTTNQVDYSKPLFQILLSEEETSHIKIVEGSIVLGSGALALKPELMNLYRDVGLLDTNQNVVVVYPTFTETAYSENGFYSYYKQLCDSSCLTVDIKRDFAGKYHVGQVSFMALTLLNYPFITDIDIDQNPSILDNYDKVILLHNEYVTRTEFDAITKHPHVIYLYPNALYAEIKTDYNNTITLIRGHGYPDQNITNGFDWSYDNTKFEYDEKCDNWYFYEIGNGKMLSCYPEQRILYDKIDRKSVV